jgi:hypothetical protein
MFDFIAFTLREGLFMLGGAFIAWNVPRPQWAKDVQAWVVAKYAELSAKVKAKFGK